MSDIHGQYDRFQNLLHQLNLQKEDKLYILGDVVDRGPHIVVWKKQKQDLTARGKQSIFIRESCRKRRKL